MANEQWESFRDIFEILDQAVENKEGIKIKFKTQAQATKFAHRAYRARIIDRKQQMLVNEVDDPKYGISVYDILSIRKLDPDVLHIASSETVSGIVSVEVL